MSNVIVIAEQKDGTLNRASWEAIAAAQQLGRPVTVVVPGAGVGAIAAILAAADVAEVVALEHEALGVYTPDGFVQALAPVIAAAAPALVIAAHTYQARDFVPALAARLDRALVTDAIGAHVESNRVVFTRQMFQGKVNADVVLEGPTPHIATFQIGAFRGDAVRKGASPAPVRTASASVDPARIRQRPEPPFREAKQAVDLTQAERIVSVGRGIKGADHIPLAQQLATALDAELAASRPICDAGWVPMERQIGSSGQTVAPKLYLALGISGAIQHVVGMKGARTIVAVNKDADAPIFEVADYGIVGDLFEIVPALIAALKQ
jgi:electron transfer flavoprotein alpha subunit